MSFCQATSCFYFTSGSEGQEIIPSSGINQIIFEVPLSTVARTLWSFEDPDDLKTKYILQNLNRLAILMKNPSKQL